MRADFFDSDPRKHSMYVSRSRIRAVEEGWCDGHWNSEKTVATAVEAEKSVEFSSNQKPAEAPMSFRIGELKSGSCLQNAGFESVIGKSTLDVSSSAGVREVVLPEALNTRLRRLDRRVRSLSRSIRDRSTMASRLNQCFSHTRARAVNFLIQPGTLGSRTDKGVWNGQSLQTVAAIVMQP